MIRIRRSTERGHANHGWLDTYYSFSFADYYNPEAMGFRSLRVINEDRIAPAAGFPTHSHRDMEIVTIMLSGALEHKDSMGSGSIIRPGEIQYMSAGSGVTHSEFNASKTEAAHLLQTWILPNVEGAPPRYDQKSFPLETRLGRFVLLASPDGADGSVAIRQDARILGAELASEMELKHPFDRRRGGYLQVALGSVKVGPHALGAGDAAAFIDESLLELTAGPEGASLYLFDLA